MKDDEIIDVYYVEDTWVCSSCKHKNKGHDLRCTKCDSPKEKNETYTTGDINQRITDPEKLKEATAGANRTCPFCKADNRIFHGRCKECGATVDEQAPPPTQSRLKPTKPAGPFVRPANPARLKIAKFRKTRILLAAACIVGCIAIPAGIYNLFRTHRVTVVVAKTQWSVTRVLQQRFTRHGSGWGEPFSAFNSTCETRLRGYVRCHPHDCNPYQESYSCRPHRCNCSTYTTTSSQRNGYSRVETHRSCDTCYDTCYRTRYRTCYDSCPDYGSWCEYDYYSWENTAKQETSNTTCRTTEPDLKAVGDLQRIERYEHYSIEFTHGKKNWSYEPKNEYEYAAMCSSKTWEADVSHVSFTPLPPK